MSNIFENRLTTNFTETEINQLAASREAYLKSLLPKTVALTSDELSSLSSMAVNNYVFVLDTVKATDAEGQAMLPPAYAQLVPILKDETDFFIQLDKEELELMDMITRVQHTKRLAAHQSYLTSTAFYKQYQVLAEAGVPGAMSRYNDLKERFSDNGPGRLQDKPV